MRFVNKQLLGFVDALLLGLGFGCALLLGLGFGCALLLGLGFVNAVLLLGYINGEFLTSFLFRNEYLLHKGINDGALAHHLFRVRI